MKKILVLLSVLALLCACQEKETFPEPVAGASYVLNGTILTDGFAWRTSASIGVYALTDGVVASNKECKIDGWMAEKDRDSSYFVPSQYEGQAMAKFETGPLDLVKGPNEFLVYSPYNPELAYVKSLGIIYNLEVTDSQTQPAPNVAGDCFSYGIASAVPGKDECFEFSLNPVTALLKISVSSNAFTGYGLRKVTVSSESLPLGGSFDININDKSIQTYETVNSVATTIKSVKAMAENETQSIYMNVLPGDYSAADLTFFLELSGKAGTICLPITHKGVALEAGKTSEILLKDISVNDNLYPWYCPTESRKLVGLEYAYGDQNTYLIQCKNGSTYTGATYTPDASIPSSVTIDYRLRGSISAAPGIPEDVTFEWAKLNNGSVYTARTANYSSSAIDPTQFTIEQNAANYTVTVTNTGAFAGAPILLMKKGDKILWGWSFWNVAADGTKLEAQNVGAYQIANMAIGQATTNAESWTANKAANGNPDPVFRTIHYYQFGRFLPIFWTTYWSNDWYYSSPGQEVASGNGNVPTISGPVATLAESLEHPYGAVLHIGSDSMNKWCTEDHGDLWGCVVSHQHDVGTKSIYDPCPKGWRVPDCDVLEAIDEAVGEAVNYCETVGNKGIYTSDKSVFIGYYGFIDYKLVSAAGSRPTNYANHENGNWTTGFSEYWCNYVASAQANSPFVYRFYGSNKTVADFKKFNQAIRSNAAPIRCQKDTENR